jgi:hypothetical protein
MALGKATVDEIEAHPQEVAHMAEQADAHGVATREQSMLTTRVSPRQLDEITREGAVQGLGGAKKRSQERKEDPLGMAPGDDCYSKQQGNMRPPQSKTHRHHATPHEYRKGEHLSMDPVGPVKVPAPRGLDCCMVVYGDKNTPHLSVRLYRSESTGGTRKIKDLLAEELTFREHDDVHYSGVKLATRFITSDSEAKLVSDGVENLCGGRAITHLKSPPRSHRYSFIEGRMKALVSKALSAYHYPGYPLSFFLHSFVHTQWQPSTCSVLTTQVRGDEGGRYKTPFERRYGKLPHATDLYRLEPRYIHTLRRRSETSILRVFKTKTTAHRKKKPKGICLTH